MRTVERRGVPRTKYAEMRNGNAGANRVTDRREIHELAKRGIPLTQAQVGRLMGVSRNYIAQVEVRAKQKIAEALRELPE